MDTASSPPNRYRPDRYQATRQRQAEKPLAYAPGRDIIAALGRYSYLTSPQILRLLYAPTSRTLVTSWLKRLKDKDYVNNDNFLAVNRDGINPRVWTFTETGRKYLQENGMTELPRIHHRRHPSPFNLDHTIAVNESLISCELLAVRSQGALRIAGIRGDEMLHQLPIAIALPGGKKANVIPDGWVSYEAEGMPYTSFCLEVDRATEDQETWRAKIAGYLKALAGDPSPYFERFGWRSARVLIVVRPKEQRDQVTPEKRIADLKKWTEAELTAQGKQNWASIFPLTTAAPEELDPRVFFGSPLWITPFATGKEPVLPGVL